MKQRARHSRTPFHGTRNFVLPCTVAAQKGNGTSGRFGQSFSLSPHPRGQLYSEILEFLQKHPLAPRISHHALRFPPPFEPLPRSALSFMPSCAFYIRRCFQETVITSLILPAFPLPLPPLRLCASALKFPRLSNTGRRNQDRSSPLRALQILCAFAFQFPAIFLTNRRFHNTPLWLRLCRAGEICG